MSYSPEATQLLKVLLDNAKREGGWDEGDRWGSATNLAFDLAEYLCFKHGEMVAEYSPGAATDAEDMPSLEAQFDGYPVDMLLEVSDGPLPALRSLLEAMGEAY
jgi:hypothetical protein